MNINYEIAGVALLAVILLIIFLIKRNQKDKKKFEKDANQSEISPDKHKEPKS